MNKINKIVLSSMLLFSTGCTTVKKALGIGQSAEEPKEPVDSNSTGEIVDNGVDFSFPSPQTNYTEFITVCIVVILVALSVRFFIKRKTNEK
jgi:hypothetical protein